MLAIGLNVLAAQKWNFFYSHLKTNNLRIYIIPVPILLDRDIFIVKCVDTITQSYYNDIK